MDKINRSVFLQQSLKAGACLLLMPLPNLFATVGNRQNIPDDVLLKKLVTANDSQVESLLQTNVDNREFNRRLVHDINILTASYCCNTSRYYHKPQLLTVLQLLVTRLLAAQAPDGTVNLGNLESPPDTAFIVEIAAAAATVLQQESMPETLPVRNNLKQFLQKAGDALTVGGVHTPNHRWVVSAALAKIYSLYPAQKYLARINEWLSEGVFINSDGAYPERSRIYSMVENTALLAMGRLLNKPALFEPVKKNLETTFYYTESNGDLVANDSRRQDQFALQQPDTNVSLRVTNYYLLYRFMAIKEKNPLFATVAKQIESLPDFADRVLKRSLIYFLEDPFLLNDMPVAGTLPLQYERVFAQSHLLRIRRNNTTATFFGGVDWPLIVASGRSCSPDFFSYRKGEAVLQYLRLSTSFFSTGYFYSEGLKKTGNRYVLSKKLTAPYYQPLPKQFRKKGGDYTLTESTDRRFWNKMDFPRRPVSNVKSLTVVVSLKETAGRCELQFDVQGQAGVQVTIELCFAEGGKFSGVAAGKEGNGFLKEGMATYEFKNDVIEFGPGVMKHQNISGLEGERYSTHFGSLRTKGMHVYLTGVTPFVHEMKFS